MTRRERSADRSKQEQPGLEDRFREVSNRITAAVGTPWAMAAAALIVVVWAITGPIFGFSDTWQLVINTGTTIVTFLMVFTIQTSQNRESKAMQLKLDELIRATKGARNVVIEEEKLPEEELERDEQAYEAIAEGDGKGGSSGSGRRSTSGSRRSSSSSRRSGSSSSSSSSKRRSGSSTRR
jgi:low affinity Fe/Cu permease